MQTFIEGADVTIIKWLIGLVGFLVILVNSILGYFFAGIHKMMKKDHEMLQAIYSEHKVFHKDETGIQ